MQFDTVGLIVALASFIGAILGAALSNLVSYRLANLKRRETRRKQELDFIEQKGKRLIELRAKLQYLQEFDHQPSNQEIREREEAYGEAYAIMLFIDDRKIHSVAENVMQKLTPHEKLTAINIAIEQLGSRYGKLIEQNN